MPDAHATSPSTRTTWWSCLVVIAVCLTVGLQTVRRDNYFLGDDFGLVHHLHDLPAARLLTYFVSDWTEGAYGVVLDELRPVLAASYWLDAHLFGAANAAGYHATNVLLHILNALLVLAIARSIAPREPLFAVFAASFFALMPSHAEPIAWISGRVDSLASLFYLGAFLCFVRFRLGYRRRWLLAALTVFAFGLFTKQSMVTLPVLIVAFDWLWFRPQDPGGRVASRVWPHIPFFVLAASYLALRHTLFGNAVREDQLTADTIKAFMLRQDSYARELMPMPIWAPTAMRTAAAVLTVGILAACAYWVFMQRRASGQVIRRVWLFGAVWYLVTIAPMIVTYLSARHLYITTAGLSIAVASLVLPGYPDENRRRRKTRAVMAGTLLVLYAVASFWDVSVWVTRGRDSQRFAVAIPRLLQTVPRGSLVFVDVPDRNRDGWFWAWSTPFALGPPFTDQDLNAAFRIVERPEIYCCPADQWWGSRKATVAALLDSSMPQEVTYITFAGDREPSFSRRSVDGRALRARIDAVQEKPIDTSPAGGMPDEGALTRVLFEQQ